MRNNTKEMGITLIALIITLIIIIILSGIVIMQLTDNGLINRAKEADKKQKEAQALENTTLENYEVAWNAIIKDKVKEEEKKYKLISDLPVEYKTNGTETGYIYYAECDISSYIENYKEKKVEDFGIEIKEYFVDRQDHVTNQLVSPEYKYLAEEGKLQIFVKGEWMYYCRPTKVNIYIKD